MIPISVAFPTKIDFSVVLHVPCGSAAGLLCVALYLLMEQSQSASLLLFRAKEDKRAR